MIHTGDCVEVMAGMEPDSIDAVVCDPPYGLEFMGKEWDSFRSDDPGTRRHRGERAGKQGQTGTTERYGDGGRTIPSNRLSYGIGYRAKTYRCPKCGTRDQFKRAKRANGKSDPHLCGDVEWIEELLHPNEPPPNAIALQNWTYQWATAALRVAKPGAYLLAFGGTRTFHRLACAIEDAGWIIRDTLVWAYAQGFPKSRANLKPAWEPICLARKPGPLRELAIDECRIATTEEERDWIRATARPNSAGQEHVGSVMNRPPTPTVNVHDAGRWPANVILTDPIFDGGWDGVVGGGSSKDGVAVRHRSGGNTFGGDSVKPPMEDMGYGGEGGMSRFFMLYDEPARPAADMTAAPTSPDRSGMSTASGTQGNGVPADVPGPRFYCIPKASRSDREPLLPGTLPLSEAPWQAAQHLNGGTACTVCGASVPNATAVHCDAPTKRVTARGTDRVNTHATVKPTELMRHLVRLVTPQGGTVLDPFLGSGTTALAAEQEGFAWVGIERDASYVDIAEARLALVQRGLGI